MSARGESPRPGGVHAFGPDRVRLLPGPLEEIQSLHRAGLLGRLEPDRLLFPFRRNSGLGQPPGVAAGYGGWDDGFVTGHYAGHYLSAAARMYAATGDVSFRDKALSMVGVLADCQRSLGGGYLSAFPAAGFDKLEAAPREASVEYYTIHKILAGLVDVAAFCGSRQALGVAARMSDYVARRAARLSAEQIEAMLRTDHSGNPRNEFGGMAAALTDLYAASRDSGDPDAGRHLRLAAVFNREWIIEPLLRGEDRLSGLHGNAHIAQAVGFARYSLAAGDERTGAAAEAFWELVVGRHSFANGGNAFNEKLRDPGVEVAGTGDSALGPLTSESCNTHNMLRLTRLLFERGPSAAYGDYCEHALFNHLLATVAPDHGKVMYHMPMRPGDYRIHIDEPYCCQGTGIENAARYGDAVYFHRDDELWVSLFVASTLDWRERGIAVRLETRYPEDGTVRLTLATAAAARVTIHLRIPAWVRGAAEVLVNGEEVRGAPAPGTFFAVARTWRDGDVLELRLPLSVRVRPSMDDPTTVSFFYGPVLLAGKLGRGGMPASDVGGHLALENAPAWSVPRLAAMAPAEPERALRPSGGGALEFSASLVDPVDGRTVTVDFAPLHTVHHQRYAVYWKQDASASTAARAAPVRSAEPSSPRGR